MSGDRLDEECRKARMTPGCVEVLIVPSLGPGAVAVVWGPSAVPCVPRKTKQQKEGAV